MASQRLTGFAESFDSHQIQDDCHFQPNTSQFRSSYDAEEEVRRRGVGDFHCT